MRNVCKAARRAVFASVAILLLVMGLAPALMPVLASNGVAAASRTIQVQSLAPGGTTQVTVEFTSLLGEPKSFALQENIPAGWTLTQGTDDASAFQPTSNTWVWFPVVAGETKTVTYTLTVPVGAMAGDYNITGTVTGAQVSVSVLGDNTITVTGDGVTGTATASRTIATPSLAPGESTEVTVTLTSELDEAKSFALQETIPDDWTLTQVTDDASAFQDSTNTWVWFSVAAGATKTVTYTLTVPGGAAIGQHPITGTVTADEMSNSIGGDNCITVTGDGVTGTASATRSIAVTTLMPGGSTEVTVEFTSLLGVAKSFALEENIPAGWTLTRGTDDASAFQPTTNTWVWFSVAAGDTKTVTYSLTAPAGAAEGIYNVTGTVTADEVSNVVGGQVTVVIGVTGDGTATATRSIAVTTLMPGGSTEVTVEFTSLLGEAKSFALQENIPAGWTLTQGTDDASAFQPTTNTWVWFSVAAGATKTVTYSLTAGVAEGTYNVTGTVTADGVSNVVGGDDTVTVATFNPMMYDTDSSGDLSKAEVLAAVLDYFKDPPLLTKAQVIAVLDFYFSQ
ncbi:MAG: NEW3 domain-containing protein [Dehalococcoidia bacterium]|nr:NEW3 domain-containing protein [Dehalococcoidia bacterium]